MKNMTINEFCERFNKGDFDSPDVNVQCEAGWYDWFCRDSSLSKKTEVLGRKVFQLKDSKKFDADKTYVFFKNNCPIVGNLYDDFRICDMKSGDVIFTVVPKGSQRDDGLSVVYGKENDFKKPLVKGNWKDIVKWFYTE